MRHLLIGVSFLANVALGAMLVSSTERTARSQHEAARTGKQPASASADDFASMLRRLIDAGTDDYVLKSTVYAAIARGEGGPDRTTHHEYWRPSPNRPYEYARARLDADDTARKRLVDVFGTDAETDPAFAELFEPLGPRFDFLSSAQQVAVQRIRLEFQHEQALLARELLQRKHVAANDLRIGAYDHERLRASLSTVLDDDMLFEYELRDSPLADELRMSGIDFVEDEFRDVFRSLQRLTKNSIDELEYLAVRNDIRSILGDSRFTQLWAYRDPRFESLRRVGDDHMLREESVFAAYGIINDSQEAMLKAYSGSSTDPAARTRLLQELQAEQSRKLTGLVGEDAARALLRALDLNDAERLRPPTSRRLFD